MLILCFKNIVEQLMDGVTDVGVVVTWFLHIAIQTRQHNLSGATRLDRTLGQLQVWFDYNHA